MSNTGVSYLRLHWQRTVHWLVTGVAVLALGHGRAVAAAEPLEIGSARQVFIDGRFMAEATNVSLEVHPPRKTGEWTIKPEHP